MGPKVDNQTCNQSMMKTLLLKKIINSDRSYAMYTMTVSSKALVDETTWFQCNKKIGPRQNPLKLRASDKSKTRVLLVLNHTQTQKTNTHLKMFVTPKPNQGAIVTLIKNAWAAPRRLTKISVLLLPLESIAKGPWTTPHYSIQRIG